MEGAGRPIIYKLLYNKIQKQRFLDDVDNAYTEKTKITYKKRLARFFEYEHRLKKDVCDFTIRELEDALLDMRSKTPVALNSIKSVISAYKDWAIKIGISNINKTICVHKLFIASEALPSNG